MNEPTRREQLARGLSQLSEFEPPPDAWAGIETRLDTRSSSHRGRAAGLAVVGIAALAIALKLTAPPLAVAPGLAEDVAPRVVAPTADPLDARSSRLEELLAALPPPRSGRASTGLTMTLLEDRIALLDERLSEPAGGDLPTETTTALKRQRVVLLDSLVKVKYASAVIVSL